MAEIVQRQSENMLRELEDLRQTKLLPEDFIRRVLKMRKQMESKINGKAAKNIDDYKNYINHEMLILEKLRKCRDKKKISEKKSSVDFSIIKRIRRLYETALQRFPSDFSLHEGFFTFCKQNVFHSTASQAVENMIKLFPYRSEVWKIAANWYLHIDVDKALQTLRKGLTINPESTLLYTTAIQIELDQLSHVDTSQEDKLFVANKCCDNIKAYVNLILNNVKNLDFIISVLKMLQDHSSTNPAQELILEYLFKNHVKEEIVWQTLAVRERKGLHFKTDPNEKPRSGGFTKSCIIYCIDKYKQGLTLVSEDKKRKLWSHYLETLIDIKEESHTSASVSRIDLLKEALQEAHTSGYLEERHYSVWVEIIPDDEARRILEESTNKYPQSEELWKLRLKYAIQTDVVSIVNSIFTQGVAVLKERALPLWLMVLRFHLLVSDTRVRTTFEKGITQPVEIANVLKPKYIEWIAFNEGIEAARNQYRILATQKPYCKELHSVMSKMELTEITIDNDAWLTVHKLACEQFGSEHIDVWVNFVKFVLFGQCYNPADLLANILSESKQKLPPFLWEQFKEIYDKLLAESCNTQK